MEEGHRKWVAELGVEFCTLIPVSLAPPGGTIRFQNPCRGQPFTPIQAALPWPLSTPPLLPRSRLPCNTIMASGWGRSMPPDSSAHHRHTRDALFPFYGNLMDI